MSDDINMDRCDICGFDLKKGEHLLRCPQCDRWGGSSCCMMAGKGTACCECENEDDE